MLKNLIVKKIPAWSAEQTKAYVNDHSPETFTLLDVRQPEEYQDKHLPGATLIPVGELHQRLEELNPTRPTIVYCRTGMRSANAASVLVKAGFKQVWNMTGGILAWQGVIATGRPEAGMLLFKGAERPEDYIALAWGLEKGAKTFYEKMAIKFKFSAPTANLFSSFSKEEESHVGILENLYRKITGDKESSPASENLKIEDMMEGGISVSQAITWADKQMAIDIIEFALAMEINAYDRYLNVSKSITGPANQKVLQLLAKEEKSHLDQLIESFKLLRQE